MRRQRARVTAEFYSISFYLRHKIGYLCGSFRSKGERDPTSFRRKQGKIISRWISLSRYRNGIETRCGFKCCTVYVYIICVRVCRAQQTMNGTRNIQVPVCPERSREETCLPWPHHGRIGTNTCAAKCDVFFQSIVQPSNSLRALLACKSDGQLVRTSFTRPLTVLSGDQRSGRNALNHKYTVINSGIVGRIEYFAGP
ncbi:hypothetical protein VTO42DRAFT_3639 [Malbranchea cinnamomea]